MNMSTDVEQAEGSIFSSVLNHADDMVQLVISKEVAFCLQPTCNIDIIHLTGLTSGEIGRHSRSREEDDMDNQPHDSEQLTCAEHVRL